MPKASLNLRPSLPTSSSDFALPPSSSSAASPSDEANPLQYRFRRPSLLAPKATYFSEARLSSPLAASFSIPLGRRGRHALGEDSESDRERMWTDSSPSSSSENPTPPLMLSTENENSSLDQVKAGKSMRSPSTPPRHSPAVGMDVQEPHASLHARKLSHPLKPPRIRNLLAEESRPEENEVRSEAAFQRLVSSYSELPLQPRTPRAASDRGRYPEEACQEDPQREETPSDDGDGDEITSAHTSTTSASESISTSKPITPAQSISGDDMFMMDSPGGAMDVDLPTISPSILSTSTPNQWRYTPPPTSSAVRSNKRKFDDRFDPYPTSTKRRAVSPSISYLRDPHSLSSRSNGSGRHPIPISIPTSTASSTTSSPTITTAHLSSGVAMGRSGSLNSPSVMSSPTMRATLGLASPILRPVHRTTARRVDGEEKEVEGAGEAVGGLSLG